MKKINHVFRYSSLHLHCVHSSLLQTNIIAAAYSEENHLTNQEAFDDLAVGERWRTLVMPAEGIQA